MSLIGVIESGDAGAIFRKIIGLVTSLFHDDVAPALETFLSQFATDFGQAALKEAQDVAQLVVSGQLSILEAAAKIVHDLGVIGVTTFMQDAKEVAANALRVHLPLTVPATDAPTAA